MDEFESLIKRFDEAWQEMESLSAKRQEAEATKQGILDAVAEGKMDLKDEKLVRKVSDAQFTLDLCAARWEAVQRLLKKLEGDISAEWTAQASIMRKWRKAKLGDMELQIQKAVEPFCMGDTKRAKRLALELTDSLPAFRHLQRRIPTNSPGTIGANLTTAALLLNAKVFLRQAKAAAKEFGLQ